MSKKVSIDNMADEIMKELDDYMETTDEAVDQAVKTVSKSTRSMLKATSPHKTGDYSKGWSVKKEVDRTNKHVVTIHNRKKPGLTHLLEKGHAKRNGGRVEGRPHIAPAEEYAMREIESEIRRKL